MAWAESASIFEMNKHLSARLAAKKADRPVRRTQVLMQAEGFAVTAHGDQRYGPGRTATISQRLSRCSATAVIAGRTRRQAGCTIVEDTPVELAEIAERFGSDVASMVDAVTGLGATRAERNARIYAGIARDPRAAVVKLADRIANVEAAPIGSDHGARYAREADALACAVRPHVPAAMWSRLETALLQHRSVAT